ncbi:MAG: hypothetical protein A2Y10_15590 [Planctomycetes bacterium GWF2_41_51]|nr:MAG: hypothetical protein A2Y10_15590 [Planctomycetes bacterium GWF2_41_51]HBG27540.1 hypothetical protein [Phycisphaerales bacterium]
MKVLIAEDDTTSRIVLQNHLKNWGYEVIAAGDGGNAWDEILTQRPEIVLIDWIMPGIDGLELCRKIRLLSNTQYIYIIFLTSKAENCDIVTALNSGADDFMSKPFDKDVFHSRIKVAERIFNYENEMRTARQKAEDSQTKLEQVNLQLELTYKKLMEAAHRAGMAEVAANVLHNVGNVLNSINVSVEIVSEKIANSEISNLQKLAHLLKQHSGNIADYLSNDPKGKHIPAYLFEAAEHLVKRKLEITENLNSLIKNVKRVKDIVKSQQLYTKNEKHRDIVHISDIIENAIEINHAGLERFKIEVIREYEELGKITIDKHRLLQMLVSIIDNAQQALTESPNQPKILKIRTAKKNNKRIKIEISDNGVGIKSEDAHKIFQQGFTTKPTGHGFGLHSCRLTANDLHGSISIHSTGVNQGATVTLELPVTEIEVKNESR